MEIETLDSKDKAQKRLEGHIEDIDMVDTPTSKKAKTQET